MAVGCLKNCKVVTSILTFSLLEKVKTLRVNKEKIVWREKQRQLNISLAQLL